VENKTSLFVDCNAAGVSVCVAPGLYDLPAEHGCVMQPKRLEKSMQHLHHPTNIEDDEVGHPDIGIAEAQANDEGAEELKVVDGVII